MDILAAGRGRPYAEGDALDHRAALVWTVPDVFDAATCARWIDRIDALGPAAAPISTSGGFAMRPDIRNNERVVIDDAALAADLYARVAHAVPPTLADRRAVGANERFRCYRYRPGQHFARHYDGYFERDTGERSLLTLMVYLNEGFEGGSTVFHDLGLVVTPRAGHALLFQHHLLHEGCTVHTGTKYALRSDIMYGPRERR